MIIGNFTKKGDDFIGSIQTVFVKTEATLTANSHKNGNDMAPDFIIETKEGFEFGAAWSKTSKAGKNYISVKLDSPEFSDALFAALFEKDGKHELVWTRGEN